MTPLQLHPVDWFNLHGIFKDIFRDDKNAHMINDQEAAYIDPGNLDADDINRPTFKLLPSGLVSVFKNNPFNIASGTIVSKFTILAAIKFKGDNRAAESHVMYKLMDLTIPYVRVGTDYYKIIEKLNRYGGTDKTLKAWGKEAITEDHTKSILKIIPKYDDFTIVPDNLNHSTIHGNCYNLYAPFPHQPSTSIISQAQIPHTMGLLHHIFGEQFGLGIKYMKLLYENPKQILPIIVLVSKERETGKTTFLNWLQMIFGENLCSITPDNIISQFNYVYATKNIILVDETIMEKSAGVEKLKHIATAKSMSVNPKHVQGYSIPFFGKIILCTNKEKDFMRIDEEEIRFWIRKVSPIKGKKNVNIENDLFNEIPDFLKYLTQLPPVDCSRSRMVFTMDEIKTTELTEVKTESKVWLQKELEIFIEDYFNNNDIDEFEASAIDIKNEWFSRDNQIKSSYIGKVLKQEMNFSPQKNKRYYPFGRKDLGKERISTPFLFKRTTPRVELPPPGQEENAIYQSHAPNLQPPGQDIPLDF